MSPKQAVIDGRMHYPVPVNGTGQSASPFWLPLPATEAARLLGKGGGRGFLSSSAFPRFTVFALSDSESLIRHVVLEQYRLPSQMAAADIALPISNGSSCENSARQAVLVYQDHA